MGVTVTVRITVGVKVGVAVGANGHNDVMGVRSKVCDAGGWQRTELFRVSTMDVRPEERTTCEPLAPYWRGWCLLS